MVEGTKGTRRAKVRLKKVARALNVLSVAGMVEAGTSLTAQMTDLGTFAATMLMAALLCWLQGVDGC
jgi:hypothetical protein